MFERIFTYQTPDGGRQPSTHWTSARVSAHGGKEESMTSGKAGCAY